MNAAGVASHMCFVNCRTSKKEGSTKASLPMHVRWTQASGRAQSTLDDIARKALLLSEPANLEEEGDDSEE
eukprot:755140-Amphidinium_carterae.1